MTREHCARQLICRGLNRACCVHLLDPILAFLTSAGYINVGLVSPPPHLRLSTNSQVGWGVFYHDLTATLPYHCLTLHRLSTNSQVGWGVFYRYLTATLPYHCLTLHRLSTNSQVGWGVFYHDLTATLPYHCLTLHRLSTNSQVGWGVFYHDLTATYLTLPLPYLT